jgi:hypothetical protein
VHELRHAARTRLYAELQDLATTVRQLGHATRETTRGNATWSVRRCRRSPITALGDASHTPRPVVRVGRQPKSRRYRQGFIHNRPQPVHRLSQGPMCEIAWRDSRAYLVVIRHNWVVVCAKWATILTRRCQRLRESGNRRECSMRRRGVEALREHGDRGLRVAM